MKKIFIGLSAICILMFGFAGCDSDYVKYSGPDYIMFSDTLSVLPVQNNDEYFDIVVAATEACDYDRTLGVEIIDKKSNAVEGRHYSLETNTVTIKAGDYQVNVRVRGIYDNIAITDSLGFVLHLVTGKNSQWELYGIETKVILQKVCPFDIHLFEGYAVVVSSYFSSYMNNLSQRLIRTEVDSNEENTVILRDYFYKGYDLKVKFTTDDLLNPLIEMEDQPFAYTPDAFNTIYGDGYIWAYQAEAYTSYYSSCEQFIFQYMTLHVPGMEVGKDVVGTYINAVKWVSDDEAQKLIEEGINNSLK